MEKFEWNIPNRINMAAIKFAGLWPEEDTYVPKLYTFYTITVTVCLIYAHNFCQAINIFFVDDLSLMTAIIFVVLSDLIAIAKLHAVVGNMKILKQLVRDIDMEIMFQPKNESQKITVRFAIRIWERVYKFFYVIAICTLFFWTFFPVLDGTFREFRLPFFTWYPFDYKKSPIYELTYVHQIVSIFYIATVNVNVDALIAALMTFVGAQCDILCDDLRNLHLARDVEKAFLNSIIHHRKILKYAESANKFFNSVVLLQFFTSAVSLGLTMFQLTVVEPFSSEFYSFVAYGNAVFVQIFMYCWFGNEVQFKSGEIPYAAYEFNWVEITPQLKKDLLFFIVKTQKPIKFSAVNLFYLTVETFVKILRSAWSYFAVLHQMNASKED